MKNFFTKYITCIILVGLTNFSHSTFADETPDLSFMSSFEDSPPCQPSPISRDSVVEFFEETSGGPSWGEATGVTHLFALSGGKFSAQQFITPSISIPKKVLFESERLVGDGAAKYTVTISNCPGDFTTHLNQDSCKVSGQTPTLKWTTEPSIAESRCLLEKDTAYYLNIVHSVDETSDYTISDCNNQFLTCGVKYAELF
ncbi:hypothetical protein [Marinicella sp. W31]|uniref:hypothetical protein n=1 Tax=Marinicella sp. W31 TaxID=3023713 RepID=UPI0037563799